VEFEQGQDWFKGGYALSARRARLLVYTYCEF
jgi:hypothetical protein